MSKYEYESKGKNNLTFSLLGIAAILIGSFLLGGVSGNALGSVISSLGGIIVGITTVYEIYLRIKKNQFMGKKDESDSKQKSTTKTKDGASTFKRKRRLVFTLRRRLSWLEWGFFTLPVIILAFILLYYGVSWKVLALAPLIVGALCLMSAIEALRGGIKGAHRYKNRAEHRRQKPHVMNRISTTILTVLLSIPVGIMSFVPVLQAAYSEKYPVVQEKQTTKAVQKKLKRYQYMLCSDGTYRSYTDEQMKDSNAGFTDDSKDYCKESGAGKMLRLTDSLEEAKANGRKSTESQQYAPPQNDNCRTEDIPYDSVRKPSSDMNAGEEYVDKGSKGTKYVCKDSSGHVSRSEVWYLPYDEVTYYGTKSPKQETTSQPSVDLNALCAHTPANSTYRGDCMERYRHQYYGN